MKNPENLGLNRLEKNPAELQFHLRPHHRIDDGKGNITFISDNETVPDGFTIKASYREGDEVYNGSDLAAVHNHEGNATIGNVVYDWKSRRAVGGALPVSLRKK